MHVFLGLEAKGQDPEGKLVEARDSLMKQDVLVMGQADVFQAPSGALSQVVECQIELSLEALLAVCRCVEAEISGVSSAGSLGNVQLGFAQKSHTESLLTLKILFYGDRIPYEGLEKRGDFLKGLSELAPDFVHPVLKKPLKELLSDA